MINKSMNASKNLPKPITKYSDGPQWIRMLAAELALRLNEAREQTPGLWPKTVVLHVRQGWATLRSKQIPFPPPPDPHTPVTVDLVAGEGEKLWKEIILNDMIFNGGGKVREWKITNLNLAFTGVHWTEEGQKSIEGFFNPQKIVSLRSASEDPSDSLRSPKKRKRSLSASPSKAKANSSLIDLTEGERSRICFIANFSWGAQIKGRFHTTSANDAGRESQLYLKLKPNYMKSQVMKTST